MCSFENVIMWLSPLRKMKKKENRRSISKMIANCTRHCEGVFRDRGNLRHKW